MKHRIIIFFVEETTIQYLIIKHDQISWSGLPKLQLTDFSKLLSFIHFSDILI